MEYCPVTLQDWLHSRSIILPEPIPAETSTGVSPAGDNFVAYQGVVTSCDRSSVGIFELDHRVSLYVTCVPAYHRFTALTLGTKIIVYNAHRKGFAKSPKIRLFCCMASCIRLVEAGKEQSPNKQFSVNSLLVKPISVYSLAASDVAALLDMPLAMTQKLHTQQCHLPISDTIPLIPVLLGSNCCPWLQEEPRNLLQEFLESPHACCVGRGQSKRRIPELVHISRETDDLSAKSQDLTDLRQKYYGSRLSVSDLNQQLYWSPVCEAVEGSEGKLLIGYLQCSRVTGRLQLLDSTGSVDLAVCSSAPPSGHLCCPTCVSPKPGQALTCPLVQPNLLGSIICVTRYKRIAERFLNTDVPNSHQIDTKYVSRSRHVLYLQISLTDCVLIHPQAGLLSGGSFNETAQETEFLEEKDRQSSSAPPSKRKRQTECDMKDESRTGDSSKSLLVYISHKESLTTLSRKESPKLRFCVLGYLIGQAKSSHSDIVQEEVVREDIVQEEVVQGDIVQEEVGQGDIVQEEVVWKDILQEEAVQEDIVQGRVVVEEVVEDRPGSAAAQAAVLLFQDDVRWYSVLEVGCFYTMTAAGQGGGFQPRPLENKMRKAIESSHTRVCVQVPPNVGVTRVISPDHIHTNNFDVVKFADFSEVLSSSFMGTQVNMQGRIVSRSHRPQTSPQGGQQRHSKPSDSLQQVNQHLGVSVLDDQCVCLQVRSLTSDAEIPVYVNLQTSSYPLGLLPGAGVEFHRLERKVSRIENVYCQFTTVSTVTLFQVSDSQRLATAPDSPVDTESKTVPHQYIIYIWRCPMSSMEFTSTCYICHFMKLCLKSVCGACGSIVTTTGCSSQACTVSDTYLSAKVSVLVDDGTSPAVVSFSNCPEHVQSLLRLSPEQWRHLEVAIQEQGEVFLQQFVGEAESVLENLLMRLCSSQHVKRQCRMILQHRVFQHGRQNTWRSGVLDIHQMNKDEFTFRSVKANVLFETRCLPYLHLECLDLKEAGYDV